MRIERACVDDRDGILRLLESSHLPTAGIDEHLRTMLVVRDGGRIVGSAGLEVYPDGALLRAVAVSPDVQGRGLGHELTTAALALAEELRVPDVYLLTTTAEGYFPRFGFERVDRADVPANVRSSVEFTTACPSTAAVMRRRLP